MARKYLTDLDVAARYGVSRVSIWRWVREGIFPSPKKIGQRLKRWDIDDLLGYEAGIGGRK